MARMKLAKRKKKNPAPQIQAFGCVMVIVILLGMFIWFFAAAVSR